MRLTRTMTVLVCAAALHLAGCRNPPGRPQYTNATKRPDQVLDFPTLYANNCAACHGDHGHSGAAIELANPVYLHLAGVAVLERVTAQGVHGTMMPPFAKSSGGLLTDDQVRIIAQGMISSWGKPSPMDDGAPAYAAIQAGDAAKGEAAFSARCANCHGANGTGKTSGIQHLGSIVDPTYLALISDQGLRSLVISGEPEQGMPDWHSYPAGPLADAEVTDIVAWLGSKRISTPGQPYRQNQGRD